MIILLDPNLGTSPFPLPNQQLDGKQMMTDKGVLRRLRSSSKCILYMHKRAAVLVCTWIDLDHLWRNFEFDFKSANWLLFELNEDDKSRYFCLIEIYKICRKIEFFLDILWNKIGWKLIIIIIYEPSNWMWMLPDEPNLSNWMPNALKIFFSIHIKLHVLNFAFIFEDP